MTKVTRRDFASWLCWIAGFILALFASAYLVAGVEWTIRKVNPGLFEYVDATIYNLTTQCVIYAVMIGMILLVSWRLHQSLTAKKIGLHRLLTWKDIGLALIGAVFYVILTVCLSYGAQAIIPGFDVSQTQDVGVSGKLYSLNLAIAFIVLVVIVPFCEETIFRGMLYGKLRQSNMSAAVSTIVVSLLFAIAHGQWNVGVDVFALSLVLCVLREKTGSVWAGFILHSIKNCVAFYVLYVAIGF